MPSALVASLSAPIREVRALVGPGWSGDPAADPAALLTGVRHMLVDVANSVVQAWQRTGAGWSGAGASAAAEFATTTTAALDDAAERAGHLGATADSAAGAVARAHRRLQAIVDEFEARASALEQKLGSPGVAAELLGEARRCLAEAISVVEELLAELDGHATALDNSGPAGSPAATAPAGLGGTGSNTGLGSGLGGGAPLGTPASWSGVGGLGELSGFSEDWSRSAEETTYGDGLAVRLPDGTMVMAPNALAASAVRHALTQLGVPYQWGGTTPGVGLDCSGLTQWSYREAGLNIPRLAQEQDIGAAVAPGALLPGDLAVWDGHVAMVVGDGTMIEAGDPVKLSPVRTSNAGQGFQGFWRPTA
ncbi:MAG: C40 family peptidase [Mycobacterium sp.]